MEFPSQFDFSKHYHRVLDITYPLLVGGTLVLGTFLARPEVRRFFFSISEIGYRSKLAVLVLSFLVLGYMFIAVVEFVVFWALYSANRLTKNRIAGQIVSNPPWLSRNWQLVATKMLGETLAPAKLSVDFDEEIKAAKANVEQIGDSDKKKAEMENIQQLESASEKNVRRWRGWYQVLKEYYELPSPRTREMFYAFGFTHALGWVGILLLALSRHFNWFVFTFSALAAAYGIWGLIFRMRCLGHFGSDSQGIPLTAAMLRDIREGSFKEVAGR